MKNKLRYLKRNNIEPEKIIAVFCKNRKTIICFESGEEFASTLLLHELEEYLPAEKYVTIRKGTIVRRDAILAIGNDGVYTLVNGRTFQGFKRSLKTHKLLRKELGISDNVTLTQNQPAEAIPLSLLEKCQLVDNMPIAYCIIELKFDEEGHSIDFIFRYCNKYMEVVEGIPVEQMVNHSFYDVFKNGDRKWLVSYADVAINGVQRTLHDYSPEIDKYLTIHCYQPEPGYCACVLQVES